MIKKTLLLAISLFIPAIYAQERSQEAKNAFKYANPCPTTGRSFGPCPGYVIDHIVALACGGADDPSNMQWQSLEDGKAKDGWERYGCKSPRRRSYFSNNTYSNSNQYYIGRKGGCYTFSASGKKRYVNHSFCQ